MKSKKFIFNLMTGIILSSCILYSHEDKTVHPYVLSGRGWDLLRKNTGQDNSPYVELGKYFNFESERSPIKKGTLGTIDEDTFPSSLSGAKHFYRPTDGGWLSDLTDTSGLAQSKMLWQDAIEKYGNQKTVSGLTFHI